MYQGKGESRQNILRYSPRIQSRNYLTRNLSWKYFRNSRWSGEYFYTDADDLSVASDTLSGKNNENLADVKPTEKFREVELRFLTEDEKKLRDQNIPLVSLTEAKTSLLAKLKSFVCFCY